MNHMEPAAIPFILLAVMAILTLVILVCREIACWYFKQTEQVKLLREIRDELKGIGGRIPPGDE